MKKLVTLLGLTTVLVISVAVSQRVTAQLGFRDPRNLGCSQDAQTLTSVTHSQVLDRDIEVSGNNRKQTISKGTRVRGTLFLRGSARCRGKWVRTTPGIKGTQLYLEDQRGVRYVNETAQVTGQDYYSNMTDTQHYHRRLRACAEYQGRRVCTEFR